MNKQILGSVFAVSFLAMSISQAAAATYHFRYPVDGVIASSGTGGGGGGGSEEPTEPTEPIVTWQEFADSYTPDPLFYPADWKELDWSAKGITDLPNDDYPSATTNNNGLTFDDNAIASLNGFNLMTDISKFSAKNNSITEVGGFNGLADANWLGGYYANEKLLTSSSYSVLYGNPVEVISGFNGIAVRGGELVIQGSSTLTAITGFQSLHTINTNALLDGNSSLADISGLSNLTHVNGTKFDLSGGALTDVYALSNLETGSGLDLSGNNIGGDIDAQLSSLTSILSLDLSDNSLTSVNLNTIQGNTNNTGIKIDNNNLTELNGFNGMTGISNFSAKNNDITEVGGFNSLTDVYWLGGGSYENTKLLTTSTYSVLYGNPVEVISGFNGMVNRDTGAGNIIIKGSSTLTAVTGFQNLETVSGSFELNDNPLLSDISGLTNLQSVGNKFDLSGNDSLVDITPIQNVSSVNRIDLPVGISARAGFTPLPSTAPLCDPSLAAAFIGEPQSDICL